MNPRQEAAPQSQHLSSLLSSAAVTPIDSIENKTSPMLEENLIEKITTSANYRQAALALTAQGDLELLKLLIGHAPAPLPENPNFIMLSFLRGFQIKNFQYRLLREAVRTGQLAIVHHFIDKVKLEPEIKDAHGRTLTYIAATEGQTHILRYLTQERNVPIDYDPTGVEPALGSVVLERAHEEVLAFLLEFSPTSAPQGDASEVKASTALEQAHHLVQLCRAAGSTDDMLLDVILADDIKTLMLLQKIKLPYPKENRSVQQYASLDVIQHALSERASDNQEGNDFKKVCLAISSKFTKAYYSSVTIKRMIDEEYDRQGLKRNSYSLVNYQRYQNLTDIALCANSFKCLSYLVNECGYKFQLTENRRYVLYKHAKQGHTDVIKIYIAYIRKHPSSRHKIKRDLIKLPSIHSPTDEEQNYQKTLAATKKDMESTLLCAAAEGGHKLLVDYLLKQHDAIIAEEKPSSHTGSRLVEICNGKHVEEVLDKAISAGDISTILLLESCDVLADKINAAAASGHLVIIHHYLDNFKRDKNLDVRSLLELIIIAAAVGHTNAVEMLLIRYKPLYLQNKMKSKQLENSLNENGRSMLRLLKEGHIQTSDIDFPSDNFSVLANNLVRLCSQHKTKVEIFFAASMSGNFADLHFLYAIGMGDRLYDEKDITDEVINRAISNNQCSTLQFYIDEFIYYPGGLLNKCLRWCDIALTRGHVEMLAFLLKLYLDSMKSTPIVKKLFDKGITQHSYDDMPGELMQACRRNDKPALEQFLTNKLRKPNPSFGWKPNFKARDAGQLANELLALWIQLDKKIDLFNRAQQLIAASKGKTIADTLQTALDEDNISVVQLFYEVDITIADTAPRSSNDLILKIARHGSLEVLNYLAKESFADQLIYAAASAGQQACVELLLRKFPSSYKAIKNCFQKFKKLSIEEKSDESPKILTSIAKTLVELCKSINAPKSTPEFQEIKQNHTPSNSKASEDVEDKLDNTLTLAVRNGDLFAIELLGILGILDRLVRANDIVKHAVKTNQLHVVQHFLELTIWPDPLNEFIHIAAAEGHLELLQYLIGYAFEFMQTEDAELTQKPHYFDPDFVVKDGKHKKMDSPLLHVSALHGQLTIVRFLIEEYFSINAVVRQKLLMKDESGRSALFIALESGHAELAAYLYQAMQNVHVLPPFVSNKDFSLKQKNQKSVYDPEERSDDEDPLEEKKAEIIAPEGHGLNEYLDPIAYYPIDPVLIAQIQPIAQSCKLYNDIEKACFQHIRAGEVENVKLLASMGVNFHVLSETGKSPIEIAAGLGHLSLVRYLVEDSKEHFQDQIGAHRHYIYQGFIRALIAQETVVANFLKEHHLNLYYQRVIPLPSLGVSYEDKLSKWLTNAATRDDVLSIDYFNRTQLLATSQTLAVKPQYLKSIFVGVLCSKEQLPAPLFYLLSQGVPVGIVKRCFAKLRNTPTKVTLHKLFFESTTQDQNLINIQKLIRYSEGTKYASSLCTLLSLANKHNLLNQQTFDKALECHKQSRAITNCILRLADFTTVTPAHFLGFMIHSASALPMLEACVELPFSVYVAQCRDTRNFARVFSQAQRVTSLHSSNHQALLSNTPFSLFSKLPIELAQTVSNFLERDGEIIFNAYNNRPNGSIKRLPLGFFKHAQPENDSYDHDRYYSLGVTE